MAKGTYIAFLDDDDYWLPTKIERQVELIKEKNCELVYCAKRLEILKDNKIEYVDVFPISLNSGDLSKRILYTVVATTSDILTWFLLAIPYLISGFMLAYIYDSSKNIYASVIAHMLNNLMSFIVIVL